MSSRDVSSLTVTELKDLLRAQGLPTAGTKAELISRLQNSDPSGQWASEVREDEVTSDERISRENNDVHQTRRELDLLQREKVLMERELEVARRERRVAAKHASCECIRARESCHTGRTVADERKDGCRVAQLF